MQKEILAVGKVKNVWCDTRKQDDINDESIAKEDCVIFRINKRVVESSASVDKMIY